MELAAVGLTKPSDLAQLPLTAGSMGLLKPMGLFYSLRLAIQGELKHGQMCDVQLVEAAPMI